MSQKSYSPTRDRAEKIAQQLSTFDFSNEGVQTSRIQSDESRLDQLETGLNELNDALNSRVSLIKDSIQNLTRAVTQSKTQREQIFEQKAKELHDVDLQFSQSLDALIQVLQRKEGEQRIIRVIEDKTGLIRQEMNNETRTRNENIEQLNSCLETDLPRLHEGIKNEITEREEMDSNITKKMNEELAKLNQLVVQEKQNRQESEQAIFDMLKDVVNRIKTEIDQERKNSFMREATEDTLLQLLEDTCNKVSTAQLA